MKVDCRDKIVLRFVEELIEDKVDEMEALERINAYTDGLAQEIFSWYDSEMEALKGDDLVAD